MFCNICGIQSFSRSNNQDGVPMVAVNVRCLDDIDTDLLSSQKFDGKNY